MIYATLRKFIGENMKKWLILMTFLMTCLASPCFASDYMREKEWADEIVPGIVVGEPIMLKQANQHEFLALYTPAKDPRLAVIDVHGLGVHPDWGLIGVLRSALADQGYTTLSLQMPVLKNGATETDYEPTFPEAKERLKLAVDFLLAKGYERIAIVSHSMGSWMSYVYLTDKPDPAVRIWVTLGMSANVDFGKLKLPVFDLYGGNDLPQVKVNAAIRKKALVGKPGSTQQMMPLADHFYTGLDKELVTAVVDYLNANFK
jgi:alpha/beta superfamily hydrolase